MDYLRDRRLDLPRSARVLDMGRLAGARVLVSGVSGPIGTALLPALKTEGAQITRLVRASSKRSAQDEATISWDPAQPIPPSAITGFDAVIHLAGDSIVGRWTPEKKKSIRDSRVLGTTHLRRLWPRQVSSLRYSFAVRRSDTTAIAEMKSLRNRARPGQGFLPDVCREWEDATKAAADAGIRTVQVRTGVVLSPKGGALGEMVVPFKLGVGGRVGSGKQWMSWIDVEDMVGGIQHALQNESDSRSGELRGAEPCHE